MNEADRKEAFERNAQALDRNAEAIDRNAKAFDRSAKVIAAVENRISDNEEFMRQLTLRHEKTARAVEARTAEMREGEIDAMLDAGRAQTRRLLASSAQFRAGRPEFLLAIERFRGGASPR